MAVLVATVDDAAVAAQLAAIASWRQQNDDQKAATDNEQPQLLPPCACCVAEDEAQTWLRCVGSGTLSLSDAAFTASPPSSFPDSLPTPPAPSSPSQPSHVDYCPPSCPLLSALLVSPLLECIALLECYVVRLPLLPSTAERLQWSVAVHHLLHAIHCQLRDEAAAAVLSVCRALRAALLHDRDRQNSVSVSHSQSQLSAASHLLLSTALHSTIAACSAATASTSTSTATVTAATTPTAPAIDVRSELFDQLLCHLGSDLDGDEARSAAFSSLPSSVSVSVAPSAQHLALFVAAVSQLAAESCGGGVNEVGGSGSGSGSGCGSGSGVGGSSAPMEDGDSSSSSSAMNGRPVLGSTAAMCRRLIVFVLSLLPPSCPHAAPAVEAQDEWLWTLLSWRLVALHIRPLLRHMSDPLQIRLTTAALRPCSRCCCLMSRVMQAPHTPVRAVSLPAASQQLLDSTAFTDSPAFATHLLHAVTAHIDRILKPHISAAGPAASVRSSRKRARPSSTAATTPPSHRSADHIAALLELLTELRCLSHIPAEAWYMDSAVSIAAALNNTSASTLLVCIVPLSCHAVIAHTTSMSAVRCVCRRLRCGAHCRRCAIGCASYVSRQQWVTCCQSPVPLPQALSPTSLFSLALEQRCLRPLFPPLFHPPLLSALSCATVCC